MNNTTTSIFTNVEIKIQLFKKRKKRKKEGRYNILQS